MGDRSHRVAVNFFWAWLLLSTLASLAGNIIHAWIAAPTGTRWLAAGVAVVPPIALLLSIHGLALLAKATATGAVYRFSLVATTALAVGAFLLSFVALRDLAIIAGIYPNLAPVLPLVIDLAIGVATLALVAIGDKPAVRRSAASHRAARTPAASDISIHRPGECSDGASVSSSRDKLPSSPPRDELWIADNATCEIAARIVAAKVTRQSTETVERILAAHHAGDPLNRIAKNLGVHHTAISKIVNAAQMHGRLDFVSG